MSDTNTPGAPTGFTMEDFSRMLSEGIAAGIAKTQRNKVTFGQYDPRTSFHPVKKDAPKFTRKYFQNGVEISWDTTHDREVLLLNRITHAGRYLDRKVEVVLIEDGSDYMVDIRYNNRTTDDRSVLKGLARDLTDMLTQIVTAQEAEDRDAEDDKLERATRPAGRRTFGNSKATQDALARAAEKA